MVQTHEDYASFLAYMWIVVIQDAAHGHQPETSHSELELQTRQILRHGKILLTVKRHLHRIVGLPMPRIMNTLRIRLVSNHKQTTA